MQRAIPTQTWMRMKAISNFLTINTHQDFVLTHPTCTGNKLQILKTSHLLPNILIDVLSIGNKEMTTTQFTKATFEISLQTS